MGDDEDKKLFEDAISALHAQVANIGVHLTVDASARQLYSRQISAMASELRGMAGRGKITWAQAAGQANEARNAIMEIVRQRSTPVGRAMAQNMKSTGKTLNELIARKTRQMFGARANFNRLTPVQQNLVYAEVVKSAGKSNPRVTGTMKHLSRAGKGLIFLSLAVSVYNVATADDKVNAAKQEAAVTAAGIGGGIAGGALAGLACGPGAPVCVTLGAFIGGGLAAFGVSVMW